MIELYGSQHLAKDTSPYDGEWKKSVELQDYKVIRLWSNDVMKGID
jgi:very-short-patch-repair endonuclease